MKRKFSLKLLKEKHDQTYSVTKEQKEHIANDNLKNIFVILHLTFLFGFLNTSAIFIRNFGNLTARTHSLIYFGSFTLISIILLVTIKIVKSLKKVSYVIKAIPFYAAIESLYFCVLFRTFYTYSITAGIILIACISLISLIFCNPAPNIFIILVLIPSVIMNRLMYEQMQAISLIADYDLFVIILIILCHFKRSVVVQAMKNSDNLKIQKEKLEAEYAKQSVEIEQQAIEILHQNRKLIKLQNDTIISLSNLVENRDSDTGAHVKRTSEYVRLLAVKAFQKKIYSDELNSDFIELIAKAAPMHDIGKIVVPDAILKKPGKLEPEEFEQIKRHTTEGGKIVKDVLGASEDQAYVQMACDVASSHHEKWNGKGYPKGLAGTEIPLSARFMALADVFDALVSPRCYKEPMSYEQAFGIIEKDSGTHFDPQLSAIFLSNKEEIIHIAEKYV